MTRLSDAYCRMVEKGKCLAPTADHWSTQGYRGTWPRVRFFEVDQRCFSYRQTCHFYVNSQYQIQDLPLIIIMKGCPSLVPRHSEVQRWAWLGRSLCPADQMFFFSHPSEPIRGATMPKGAEGIQVCSHSRSYLSLSLTRLVRVPVQVPQPWRTA